MKARIETSFAGLVVAFHAVLSAIERSDEFRVVTVEKKGIGTELNRPVEEQISRQWDFVADLRRALVEADANIEHFDKDISRTWSKLRSGAEVKPWTSGFDWMTRTACKMGVEQELAAAA